MEWNVVATQGRRVGLERGEKLRTKCSSGGIYGGMEKGGRNVRRVERGVHVVSQICGMQTVEGGERERNVGEGWEAKKGEKLIWTREL